MALNIFPLLLLLAPLIVYSTNSLTINLCTEGVWRFYSSSNSSIGSHLAVVPGDIFADLQRAGVITRDPLTGSGDIELRWVSREDWVYEATFNVTGQLDEVEFNDFLYIALAICAIKFLNLFKIKNFINYYYNL